MEFHDHCWIYLSEQVQFYIQNDYNVGYNLISKNDFGVKKLMYFNFEIKYFYI